MKNRFPGMNPWLEEFWQDVHAKLLVYACDQLNAELPPELHARVDERLAIGAEEGATRRVGTRHEFYSALAQRLPGDPRALRRSDADGSDLQLLIDACYEGRARVIDYQAARSRALTRSGLGADILRTRALSKIVDQRPRGANGRPRTALEPKQRFAIGSNTAFT